MSAFYLVMRLVLSAVYACMKLVCRVRPRRVVFLSRQSNEPELDFKLLMARLQRLPEPVECKVICCRSDRDRRSMLRYSVALLRSLYYLATSSACICNSYWPAVSMLRHRKGLTVIQLWHAAGKIKQSGYQTVGRPLGHSESAARVMRMHRGYDIVIAGAPSWNPFYCASFGISEEVIVNLGLPRFDYLQQPREPVRERFDRVYPQARGKRLVLYAPTFRPGVEEGAAVLMAALTADPANAVVFRRHPNERLGVVEDPERLLDAPDFSTMNLLLACDYVITDYSAIAVEAASANVRTLYYLFDVEEYAAKNGLNVDPRASMPACAYIRAEDVARALNEPYPDAELLAYRAKYVLPPEDLGRSTERIVQMVEEVLRTGSAAAGLACAAATAGTAPQAGGAVAPAEGAAALVGVAAEKTGAGVPMAACAGAAVVTVAGARTAPGKAGTADAAPSEAAAASAGSVPSEAPATAAASVPPDSPAAAAAPVSPDSPAAAPPQGGPAHD